MGTLRIRIGGDGPVVVESEGIRWRLIVRGQTYSTGADSQGLHVELRELALRDSALARDAFGVICTCAGGGEAEYPEEHGEDALVFEDGREPLALRGLPWVGDAGDLNPRL